MPFETFVHPCYKQCLQPRILISNEVVSSAEGLVTTSTGEDIATVAAVEHSATEVALSRLMHLRHGGSNPS